MSKYKIELKEQRNRLYEHLRTESGNVPVEKVGETVAEIFRGMGPEGKNELP